MSGADALVAARLLALDPGLGGLWLRGDGPVRDQVMEALAATLPLRRLPLHVEDTRLSGGLDIAATAAAGRPVHSPGLLTEAAGAALVIAGAERLPAATAGRIAAAMDAGGTFTLILLDDGIGAEERPPDILSDRIAFHLDFGAERDIAGAADDDAPSLPVGSVEAPADAIVAALANAAAALGVRSSRADLLALRAARAAAAAADRTLISAEDAALAARLVLAPRATQAPAAPDEAPAPEGEAAEPDKEARDSPEDVVLDAVRAALPPDLLDARAGARRGPPPRTSGAGERRRGQLRGRPIGTRAGLPRGGLRLALVDTLRAAAPWQRLRGAAPGEKPRLRREDLRVRRFEARAETLTIFAVDASGSAALARLAEAKGAVELLLARSYAKRAEVALIAFRGASAETLLPPTRSLTRGRRLLAALPGGGGTPLAAGIDAARVLADAARQRGRTPSVVLLTDGRANVAADGAPGRAAAMTEAEAAARRVASARVQAVLIDIGARPQPDAARLASEMAARYVHLPKADAAALHAATQA